MGDMRNMVEYFRGRNEVSALYVFGIRKGMANPERELGLGVLLDRTGCRKGECDFLDMGTWDISDDFPEWKANVVLLNDAPPFVQYHVVRKGSVVFEKDQSYRVRFAQRALDQFLNERDKVVFVVEGAEDYGADFYEAVEGDGI
jgi:hypothetical protein